MRLLTLSLALAALAPAIARASPQPTERRIAVFLIPMDLKAEAETPKLASYMDQALVEYPKLQVTQNAALFGMPGDVKAELALKRADTGFREGQAAYNDHDWDDAERKLHSTIEEYKKAAAAMKGCDHLCDAIAMYASVMYHRGETDEARLALLDLMSLSPAYELSPKVFVRSFIAFRVKAAGSVESFLRGSAKVITRPAGARVYLDDEFVGYAPLSLPTSRAGKHLLRIERPGFEKTGKVIELTPEAQEVRFQLVPTPAYKGFDSMADALANESIRQDGGPNLVTLGQTFHLDRAIVGTVRRLEESNETELLVGLFDLRTGKKLTGRRLRYQGDEYGELKSEIGRAVNGLLHSVAAPVKVSRSADPLDHHSGMEDWNKDGPSPTDQDRKAAKGDPLDSVDGTEDW